MPSVMKPSIRRQLALVVLGTSLLGLGIVCAVFELHARASFRRDLTAELSALVDTVGANSVAALTFYDRESAEEVLAGLGAEQHIVAASLYNTHGQVFAEYRRPGVDRNFRMPPSEPDGARFAANSLTLHRTIFIRGEKAGSIAIVSDLKSFQAKIREYTEISALALLLSVLATMFVSSRLLRLITEPILQLADVAGKVSSEENYALRATAHSNDEVGMLVRSFNGMLERIQERDAKLKEVNDELELRVEARTKELQSEVAERLRAQEALFEERQVLRALIDNVPDYMYVKDATCRFLVANVAVARQMGAKTPEELLGKTDFDFYPRELATTFYEDERKVITSGRAEINREEAGLDPQGNMSQVLTTQVPLRDKNGRVTGLAGIGRDITQLKKAQAEMQKAREAAEAASRAKSEFLANMSHEIRTPLNGIVGMTDLALETELTQEQKEFLETVKTSSESLLKIINDILDFSKIEAGMMDLETIDFRLRENLESTIKTLAIRADEKGLELLCEVAPEIPEVLRGDAARLRQVVLNLVGNAIKFTKEGEVTVTVQREAKKGNDLLLHFVVSDTGIGIPEEKRKLIFDPFAQADSSTTRKYGGTGLGLTISTRLVQMMGGRIWVESKEGQGSQFHFTIRLSAAEGQELKVDGAVSPLVLRGVRVLVVDDNTTNRRILEGTLRRWGMTPASAAGGEEALAKLASALDARKPFGLILTDMHMPKMDGFELVERIRARPELSTATIMMLTSAGHRGDVKRCQMLGVSAYLLKPIRQSELQEAIARVLGSREPGSKAAPITPLALDKASDPRGVLRILVAEDNPVNQRLIVRLLEKRGHRAAVAANGREVLEALERDTFDIVLMDVQMPEMDGFEATAAIRMKEKKTGVHQAIVALTAHAMKGDREKCLAEGMDGYLTKPIRAQELDEILTRYRARPHAVA